MRELSEETKRPWCVGENIFREAGDWQRMLVERTRAEEERVKASRAEESVRWPGGRRRERAEKHKSRRGRRWGTDEAESRVIPAVNLLYVSLPCVCLRVRV